MAMFDDIGGYLGPRAKPPRCWVEGDNALLSEDTPMIEPFSRQC